jgi:hypothetical protein
MQQCIYAGSGWSAMECVFSFDFSKILILQVDTDISPTARCSMISYLLPCLVSFCLTYLLLYLMSTYGNSLSGKSRKS